MNIDFSNTWREKKIAEADKWLRECFNKGLSKEEAFLLVIDNVKEVTDDDVKAQFIGHMILNNKE